MKSLKYLSESLALGEDEEPPLKDRQDVVEYLDHEISYQRIRQRRALGRSDDGAEITISLTMPLKAFEQLVQCARDGMHKGQGRRGVRLERRELLHQLNVLLWAKEIKKELRHKSSAKDAERDAAEQASKLGHQRYGLNIAPGTIKRALGWRA